MNNSAIEIYCKDIKKWPESWEIVKQDIKCGNKIVESVFIPFIEFIIDKGLSRKTIKKHIDNLWLLGGGIIYRVNCDEELRKLEPKLLVQEFIDDEGGPYSRHIDTEAEIKSFDSTCKKLFKFMKIQLRSV
jgi:hypothetical protein